MTAGFKKHYLATAKARATASTLATKLVDGRVYSVLKTLELGTGGAIKLLLIRDPTGTHSFNGEYKDPLTNTAKWTAEMLGSLEQLQMIRGNASEIRIDNSLFFMTIAEFGAAFERVYIAHARVDDGYNSAWYDRDNDDGQMRTYTVTVPI